MIQLQGVADLIGLCRLLANNLAGVFIASERGKLECRRWKTNRTCFRPISYFVPTAEVFAGHFESAVRPLELLKLPPDFGPSLFTLGFA